jgi:hypothetical protein
MSTFPTWVREGTRPSPIHSVEQLIESLPIQSRERREGRSAPARESTIVARAMLVPYAVRDQVRGCG